MVGVETHPRQEIHMMLNLIDALVSCGNPVAQLLVILGISAVAVTDGVGLRPRVAEPVPSEALG